MSLTNTQYNSIMRMYEERQNRNRHVRDERLRYVYENVNGYRKLDESVATISVAQGKKMLSGDKDALKDLKVSLHRLSEDKARLLAQSGLPSDFLAPVYDCPDCKDTGYVDGSKCHCFKQEEISLLYQQSNIREMLEQENFDSLSYDFFEGEQLASYRSAVSLCKDFIDHFSALHSNLFFYGTVGSGKTFLTNCIAGECMRGGHSVIYFSASNLFDTLARNSFDYKNQEILDGLYQDLYNCDLLVIDDLGTEQSTAFTLSHLFACVNERLIRRKSVIISTNLSLPEFQERYKDRIFSRITSNYTFCKLTGPDIRMCKKRLLSRK